MAGLAFLFDQHLPRWWRTNLLRVDPTIRALNTGDEGAPALGTRDPELLAYCEENRMAIVTCDRRTMYDHIAAHEAMGREFWGMFMVDGPITTEELVFQLQFFHATLTAEEFAGCTQRIPI